MNGMITEAIRTLRRSPIFTSTVVGSLGLAIGLAASVWAVVYAIFLAPLPFHEPDRLVELWQSREPGSAAVSDYLQPSLVESWSALEWRTLEAVTGAAVGMPLVERSPDGTRRVTVRPIVGDWFATMGVAAARGRVLAPEDFGPGSAPAAVVSDAFRRARPDLDVGSTLDLSGSVFAVVGIMPARFESGAEVWVAASSLPAEHRPVAYAGFGRLRDVVRPEAAVEEILRRSVAEHAEAPDAYGGFGVTARPMGAQARGTEKPTLWLLGGVALSVLLLGMSNVTQLFLARTQSGRTALAIRAALGGSTWQVGRGMMVEASLVGVAGGLLGVLLARWGVRVVVMFLGGQYVFASPPVVGLHVVALSAGLAIIAALVVGAEPLRRVAGLDVREMLQRRSAGAVSTRGERGTRNVLVAAQVGTSLLLVAVTVVLASAYRSYQGLDVGYDAGLVQAMPDYELAEMDSREQWSVARRLLPRLEQSPDIDAVAVWQMIAMDYPPRAELTVVTDGPSMDLEPAEMLGAFYRVPPGAIEALGIDVLEGRTLGEADHAGAPLVALLTRTGAEAYWPDESAVGRQLKLGRDAPWMTVVGVVEDHQRFDQLGRAVAPRERWAPLLLAPEIQWPEPPPGWREFSCCAGVMIAVRPRVSEPEAARLVRAELAVVAPDLPIDRLGTILDLQMDSFYGRGMLATGRLASAGALVALLLSVIGVVGVVGEGLSRRRRELAVRIALGARPLQVTGVAARESLITAAAGAGVGIVAAIALDRLARGFVFDYMVRRLEGGLDMVPLTIAACSVLTTAAVASLLVSRSATSVDPALVLRDE
jgi:predicted permease